MPLIRDPALNQSLLTPRGFVPLGVDTSIHPTPPPVEDKSSFNFGLQSLFPDEESVVQFGLNPFVGLAVNPTVQAAFRQSNTIGSAIAKYQDVRGVDNSFTDPNYSPWKDVVGTPYEKYWKHTFAYSNNPQYTAALKNSIDRQQADARTVAAGGAFGTVAGIAAGAIDPTLLIPGGGEVNLARKGVWTLASGALSGARAGAIGMTAYELGLQASQDTRTPQESIANIATGTILSAVLGGGIASVLSKTQRVASEKGLEELQKLYVPPEASLSSASAFHPTLDDLTIEGKAARTVAAITAFSPNTRSNFLESPLARQTMQELTDVAPLQHMHTEGETLGPDVTNSIRVSLAETLDQAIPQHYKIYGDSKKDTGMSIGDFEDAVGNAMRNNDVGVNDAVSKAAKMWRGVVTEPLLQQAIALKMLPEDVKVSEAPSYFMRDWNKEKLIAQAPDVLERFADHFQGMLDNGYQKAAEELRGRQSELDQEAEGLGLTAKKRAKGGLDEVTPEQATSRRAEIIAEKKALDRAFYDRWEIKRGGNVDPYDPTKVPDFRAHAKDLAQEVHSRLTGQDYGSNLIDPEYNRPIAFGPLKNRTFHIPDEKVQDLLRSNVREVMTKFSRKMSAQIELTRKFGDINLGKRIEEVGNEYKVLTEHAATEQERLALATDFKNFVRDVIAIRDMHLGTYMAKENGSVPGRVSRALKNVNFILRMGGPALPHLSNLYAPALFHTTGRYMEEGIGPLLKGIDAVGPLNKEARWAVGLEGITHHQLLTLTGIGDPYARGTRIERLLDKTTNFGARFNGLNILINGEKNIASWVVQARLNQALMKGGDETWLAYSGLSKSMQGNVAKFLEKYGTEEAGHLVANTDKWIEEGGAAGWEAARAYRVAVAKNVNSDIVSRAPGDLPLAAQTPLGSLFFQFRTFQLIAHQRMLFRVLQLPTAQAISGIMGLTSLGMLAAVMKAWHSGQPGWERFKESAQNPGYMVAEGLDNAAFFTLPVEIGNDVERVSGSAGYPVNPVKLPLSLAGRLIKPDAPIEANTQQGELSNDWTSIGGPTVSLGSDIIHGVGGPIVAKATGQQVTKREVHAAQRLVPFNSYVGMRELLQATSGDSTYIKQ